MSEAPRFHTADARQLDDITLMQEAVAFNALFASAYDRLGKFQADGPRPTYLDETKQNHILVGMNRDATEQEATYATTWRQECDPAVTVTRSITIGRGFPSSLRFMHKTTHGIHDAPAEKQVPIVETFMISDMVGAHILINKELKMLLSWMPTAEGRQYAIARVQLITPPQDLRTL